MQRAVWTMARAMAAIGGIVLLSLIVLTCLSILGRALNGLLNGAMLQWTSPGLADWVLGLGVGPILGHVELVEAGVAFAIFCFLPLCQLSGAHAKVGIFTDRMPARLRRWLIAGIDGVYAVILILIAWRLSQGLVEKREFSETSFMLQFPIWWAYAASLSAAVAAAFAGVFVAFGRLVEATTGQVYLAADKDPVG